MLTRHKSRSRRTLYAFRAALILFCVYCGYHAFHGNHGLIAYANVQVRVAELQERQGALEARRAFLLSRVEALADRALDADLVDERARQTLAYIGVNERIVRP